MRSLMSEPIICLQCGGVVDGGEPSDPRCTCPPPSEAGRITCPGCGGALRVGARACPFCNSTIATCRCPACLAWNLAGAVHCQACGHALTGHTHDQGKIVDMDCPRCAARLHVRKYAELDVDECDQCGGLFISPAMLDAIVASRDKPKGLQLALPKRVYRREIEVKYVHCPQCRTVMNRKMFGRISGVIVDVCKDHGVWFDAGELNEVLEWVARGGLDLARDKEKADLQEQARSLRTQQMAASLHQPMVDDTRSLRLGGLRAGVSAGSEIVAAFIELWHDLK
jgi:Zn-finger nucleic acid-binding protein